MTAVNRAWYGVVVLFLIHGIVVASWISRIPGVQNALHLTNGILGLTLLSSAVGAVLTIPFSGYLVSKYGSKLVCGAASIAFCLSVILPGLARSAVTLALALFAYGVFAAGMDVAMNAQGVEVERRLGKPTMSRFHGMFSLGAMIGAGFGGLLAAHEVPPLRQFTGSALVNVLGVLAALPLLIRDAPQAEETEHRLSFRNLPIVLVALSAIGFLMLLSEGAMADWIAVYLRQQFKAGGGLAAWGFSVFSAAMALFRFLGDWITSRLGPMRTVRSGCVVAAGSLLWALAAPTALWSLPGFAGTGVGLSVIIPLVFGGGGRVTGVSPGAGIATVTGLGYIGFIVGPPVIGFASEVVTLRYALGIVVLCCLLAAWFAKSMRLLAPISGKTQEG